MVAYIRFWERFCVIGAALGLVLGTLLASWGAWKQAHGVFVGHQFIEVATFLALASGVLALLTRWLGSAMRRSYAKAERKPRP